MSTTVNMMMMSAQRCPSRAGARPTVGESIRDVVACAIIMTVCFFVLLTAATTKVASALLGPRTTTADALRGTAVTVDGQRAQPPPSLSR